MGGEVRKQAEELRLTNLHLTTLYGQHPFYVTVRRKAIGALINPIFAKNVPNVVLAIHDYIALNFEESNVFTDTTGGMRNKTYYILAPQVPFYAEIADKTQGMGDLKIENRVLEFKIFCDSEDHVRKIANVVNETVGVGIVDFTDWEKIEKKYKVNKEECIANWKALVKLYGGVWEQVNALGLDKQRMTVLYAQPRSIGMIYGRSYPDIIWAIREYVHSTDPYFLESRSLSMNNSMYFFLATTNRLFVEIRDNFGIRTSSHAIEIKIYSDDLQYTRAIAQAVNRVYEDGILPHIKWKKVAKKYGINKDLCIAEWEKLLET